MTWAIVWTVLALLALAVVASCGWHLWHRARALGRELGAQGRRVDELAQLLGSIRLPENPSA